MAGNSVVDILKELAMNKEIQKVIEKRFDLALSTPATSSSLRNLIGYNVDTTFTKDLLQRKVPIPPDVDTIIAELIEEMCCLWACLRLSHGPVEITPAIYKYDWGGVNEATSLALSGIHFGHWKIFHLSSKLIQVSGLTVGKSTLRCQDNITLPVGGTMGRGLVGGSTIGMTCVAALSASRGHLPWREKSRTWFAHYIA
jgi:hypothetical protein